MRAKFRTMTRNPSVGHRDGARALGRLCAAVLLVGLAIVPRAVWADCEYSNSNHQAGVVTFNAGTINITLNQPASPTSPIYTSNTNAVPPGTPLYLTCFGSTPSGLVNQIAGQPSGGDNTLFPTGIPGISYRLLHPDASNYLSSYPNYTINANGPVSFSVASNLALYYVGPYLPSNNSTINGEIAIWNVDVCSANLNAGGQCRGRGRSTSPEPVEIFNLNATIHILVPTCDISAGSVNKGVALSAVNTTAFSAPGSVAGLTPFSLQLTNCSNNLKVYITLNTNNPQAGATGVIAPTAGAGYASGIGVQILESDETTPVTFGQVFQTGTTSGSSYTVNLYARYYQTAPTVTAGNVQGIATYTVEYQ